MIIYRVTNTVDGKIYIGKTVQSLKRRKQCHLAHAKRGCTFYFHRAIRKHGVDSFQWDIIATHDLKEYLGELEKKFIKEYREKATLYNLTDGGEGVCGRKCSEETKRKISIANKGQVPWMKGKKMTDEHKKKLSESKRNPSEETRAKMRAASVGRNVGRMQPEDEKTRRAEAGRGRVTSEETKKKLSIGKLGKLNPRFGKAPWNKGMVNGHFPG